MPPCKGDQSAAERPAQRPCSTSAQALETWDAQHRHENHGVKIRSAQRSAWRAPPGMSHGCPGFVSACQWHQTLRQAQRNSSAGVRCADMPEQASRTLSRRCLPSGTAALWLAFNADVRLDSAWSACRAHACGLLRDLQDTAGHSPWQADLRPGSGLHTARWRA